jgi:hypothetical protein
MPPPLTKSDAIPHPYAILGGIVTAAAILLILTPPEQTLGDGIRIVFIHAALIQTGAVGLVVAGLAGLAALVTGREDVAAWMRTIAPIAIGFYIAGLVMSVFAAQMLWGGVFFEEPRYQLSLYAIGLGTILVVVAIWMRDLPHGNRIAGGLFAGLAAYLIYALATTPMILHPSNPVGTSSSPLIKATFYGLLGASLLAAGWAVWRITAGAADIIGSGECHALPSRSGNESGDGDKIYVNGAAPLHQRGWIARGRGHQEYRTRPSRCT